MGDEDCAIGVEEIAGVFVNGTCHCGNCACSLRDADSVPAFSGLESPCCGQAELCCRAVAVDVGGLFAGNEDVEGEFRKGLLLPEFTTGGES